MGSLRPPDTHIHRYWNIAKPQIPQQGMKNPPMRYCLPANPRQEPNRQLSSFRTFDTSIFVYQSIVFRAHSRFLLYHLTGRPEPVIQTYGGRLIWAFFFLLLAKFTTKPSRFREHIPRNRRWISKRHKERQTPGDGVIGMEFSDIDQCTSLSGASCNRRLTKKPELKL